MHEMYLVYRDEKLKTVKIEGVWTGRFRLFAIINPDDGRQRKTFGLNLFNFCSF